MALQDSRSLSLMAREALLISSLAVDAEALEAGAGADGGDGGRHPARVRPALRHAFAKREDG